MSFILDTLPEEDFRRDENAVQALVNFLASDAGVKFARALRGGRIGSRLASERTHEPHAIRDAALAEAGTAHNLLGKVEGYDLALAMIDRLTMKFEQPVESPAMRQSDRVGKVMRRGPSDA